MPLSKHSNVRNSYWATLVCGGRDFVIGVILLYGYVYTAYKYGNPLFGRNDFFRYQQIILHPFDLSAVSAPFVLRQIPAIIASGFYHLGFQFDTAATIDSIGFDEAEKRRFFAMILSNGSAACLSFSVLAGYLRQKLKTDNLINALALFGIFAGWFYFPSAVIAPVTIGWGWLVSSLFAIAFIERNAAVTAIACGIALFSRETTLIFALMMFLALLFFGGERNRGVVASLVVLAASCLLYLALRIGFTSGYAHQIDPAHIAAQLTSLSFPIHFFVQSVLAQAILVFLLGLIAIRRPRYAAYLVISAVAVLVVAMATNVTDAGLLLGETLPFYAAIFMLAWSGALTAGTKGTLPAMADGTHSARRSEIAD